ncbi:unnamed protein product [Bursaphelenchus okinawaensis]|uniref:Uncharacterized protein n=1 Tax=Bursaphelenchus okinawaensis TaxID=465554 RepID=A0A811L6F4_9BILA|nr:unnamed protein product [Bursaphelenchus okinawaensis]CAG9116772.1 unnamed protein product [Bursaphelenchus okinawaensis]
MCFPKTYKPKTVVKKSDHPPRFRTKEAAPQPSNKTPPGLFATAKPDKQPKHSAEGQRILRKKGKKASNNKVDRSDAAMQRKKRKHVKKPPPQFDPQKMPDPVSLVDSRGHRRRPMTATHASTLTTSIEHDDTLTDPEFSQSRFTGREKKDDRVEPLKDNKEDKSSYL